MTLSLQDFLSSLVSNPMLILTVLLHLGRHFCQRLDRMPPMPCHLRFHPFHGPPRRHFNGRRAATSSGCWS